MVQIRSAPEDRMIARKREILRAASRIFRKQGFHATGMRDVAAALGIAVGKLYYYFSSKQDLLAFCQEDSLERLLAVADAVARTELRPEERLFAQIVMHVRCLNEGSRGSLAHLEIDALGGEQRSRVVALRDRYERTFRELVQAGIDDGGLRPGDPKYATLAILGAVNWTARWYDPDGRDGALEVGINFANHLVGGLLSEAREIRIPTEAMSALESAIDDDEDA